MEVVKMLLKKVQIIILKATLFFSVALCYSQSSEIKELQKSIKTQDFKQAKIISKKIKSNLLNKTELAQYHYYLAKINLHDNQDDLAFNHYIESKKQFKAIDSIDKEAQINIEIVSLLLARNRNNVDYHTFLNEYAAYAKQKNNPTILSQSYMQIGKSFYDTLPKMALHYFKKAEKEIIKTNDEIYHGRILQNMGATYAHKKINNIDSAFIVYDKALAIFKKNKLTNFIFNIYTNKGVAYSKIKDYKNAINYFQKADSIPLKEYLNKNKEILYGFISKTYKDKGDYKKAIEYLEKQKTYQEILNQEEQEIAIKDIDTKYKTQEKELENIKLKNKIQTNRIINGIGIGLIIILLTLSTLAYKNITKKRKIAEQEKLIKIQKLETTLKEQELHEIDVMLESQEKERQRIANELHDNLGSMMATLKLNFQNLKRQKESIDSKENLLYDKTDALIDEAYQKIRNISHLKNLGVIGSEGLLVAVKKMSEKMSVLDKLNINVIPFGLSERLENPKEIILFRMIQELCTNIIKHSKATDVNIYLTQHSEKEMNIIIEDNGIGFDPKKINSKDGIGLRNIEKKVEQMGGTFTIDSLVDKGTTIIIDLPL